MEPKQPTASQLRALRRADPVLAAAMRRVPRFPGFPNPRLHPYRSHFHALARAIVYQQLAGKAARTIHDRVRRLTPGRGFPRPEECLELPDAALRGAGLSQNKLLAIRDLAGRVVDGRLELRRLHRLPDAEVVEALTAVRGIGEWTAQMFLMFRLGRLDVMPWNDLGVREGVRRLDGLAERPTPKETLARGEVWRPLCSVAAWTMWRLCDVETP